MPRSYKNPSIVSGLSINDILTMDFDKWERLNAKELRQITSRLASAANKRITNFQKTGEDSPALTDVMESGGKFSVRGKNLGELRKEFTRAKGFLEQKTSTVTEWRKVRSKTISTLGKKYGIKVSKEQFDKFFKVYNKLRKEDHSIADRQMRYAVFAKLSETVTDDPEKSIDELTVDMMERLTEIYEENMETVRDDNGVSSFFDNGSSEDL